MLQSKFASLCAIGSALRKHADCPTTRIKLANDRQLDENGNIVQKVLVPQPSAEKALVIQKRMESKSSESVRNLPGLL